MDNLDDYYKESERATKFTSQPLMTKILSKMNPRKMIVIGLYFMISGIIINIYMIYKLITLIF